MLILFIFLFLSSAASAQSIEVQPSIRVDTTDATQRELFTLWKNYLNSRPDSNYNNPYWSEADKQRYPSFDVAGGFIYHVVTGRVQMWKPHLISIEPFGDRYELRTAYLSLDTSYPEQHIWAVQRIHAVRENDAWKLSNPISAINASSTHRQLGNIEFIYRPDLAFDEVLARQTLALADSIVKTFDLTPLPKIEFYIGRNCGEMYEMIGLPLFLAAGGGVAYVENGQLFTSLGTPWYPHELVHVLFHEYKAVHGIISEGIATYLAGSSYEKPSYGESIVAARKSFVKGQTGLEVVLDNQWINGDRDLYYGTGGWLVEQILVKSGVEGLKRVMRAGKLSEQLRQALLKELNMTWEDLQARWKSCME